MFSEGLNSTANAKLPGFHNDLGYLGAGDWGNITDEVKYNLTRTQMILYSMLSSQLFLSFDVNEKTPFAPGELSILKNPKIISVDQDPLSLQAERVYISSNTNVYYKPLYKPGSFALAVEFSPSENKADDFKIGDGGVISWDSLNVTNPSAINIFDVVNNKLIPLQHDASGYYFTPPDTDSGALRTDLFIITGAKEYAAMDEINGNVASDVSLYDVQPVYSSTGWGTIHHNTSATGENFIIGGKVIPEVGLGVHAPSQVVYRINKKCSNFTVGIGVDQNQSKEKSLIQVRFEIWGDNTLLAYATKSNSQSMSSLTANLSSYNNLRLVVRPITNKPSYGWLPNNHYEYSDWVKPMIKCQN